MDLIEVIENIQDSTYNFALKYYIEPQSKEEHYAFLDFCRDKGISLASGKDFSTIPYINSNEFNKIRFALFKSNKGIILTYESNYYFVAREKIFVPTFFKLYEENEYNGTK